MTVEIAKSAGFCFGVERAVHIAEQAALRGEYWCLGLLIHNDDVVAHLKEIGITTVDSISDLPDGARVIIRTHGAAKREYEELEAKGCEIIDATCPRVSHIHAIVREVSRQGRIPVVIGSKGHPEVRAICGWGEDALIFSGAIELTKWFSEDESRSRLPLSFVFQSTFQGTERDECYKIIKKECTLGEVFDTICNATSIRQDEAGKLSQRSDAIIVVGSRKSANSVRLAEICSQHCEKVQFIERANEIDFDVLAGVGNIGIVAGASTPAWIIKEVNKEMCDEKNVTELENETITAEGAAVEPEVEPVQTTEVEEGNTVDVAATADDEPAAVAEEAEVEKSFEEMLEDSIKTISNGDTVIGIVAAITATEISVDLGTKHSGYIPISEFTDDSNAKIEDILQIGSKIEAIVVRVNDVEGTVMLSKRRLDAVKNWNDIELAAADGNTVEGTVTEENKGGVVVSVSGIRVFVPASQTGLSKSEPMSDLLRKKVRLKIKEVNRSRRRVVGSIREVQMRERREMADKVWAEIETGKYYDGIVKSLTSYGAFVDIGGVDGMVHVSELSWSRVRQPSEVVSVGDAIRVYVVDFDKEAKKISLGCKDPDANPWVQFTKAYNEGDIANVKVVKLIPFGAFAEVMPGVDGLIHISQIANRRIGKPDEVLTVGEMVDAKIISIDNEKQKISLSIRAILEGEPAPRQMDEEEEMISSPRTSEPDALVYEVSETGVSSGLEPADVGE